MVIPSILWSDKKEWTKEELLNQLKPMCKFFATYSLFETKLIAALFDSFQR